MQPRRSCSAILACLLCSATLSLSGSASAQSPSPSGTGTTAGAEAIRDDVRLLYKDALTAYQQKDYESAYKGFLAAWNLQRVPRIAGNLARTELKLGKYRDAAEHFALFLREEKDLPEDQRKAFMTSFDEAKAKVGRLKLDVKPAGAEILVDGVPVGVAPLDAEIYVDPGSHTVEARSHRSVLRKSVDVAAGAEPVSTTLDVPPPPVATVAPPRTPAPLATHAFPVRAVVLASGGAVAVIGGILMGVALSDKSRAEAEVPKDDSGAPLCAKAPGNDRGSAEKCDKIRALAFSADAEWSAGLSLLIVGGVVAGGAAASWLLPDSTKSPKKSTSFVVPTFGPSGAGIVWRASF